MALEAIQAQAGHRSIESTRIYLHLANDWLAGEYRRASEAIDAQATLAVVMPAPLRLSDAAGRPGRPVRDGAPRGRADAVAHDRSKPPGPSARRLQRAGGWARAVAARQLEADQEGAGRSRPGSWSPASSPSRPTSSVALISAWGSPRATTAPTPTPGSSTAAERLGIRPADTMLQWSTLAKITALTGTAAGCDRPGRVRAGPHGHRRRVHRARVAVCRTEHGRHLPPAPAHAVPRRAPRHLHAGHGSRPPVSVRGWAVVAPGFTEVARRYVDQVALSLRPSTVAHIEHDLREFGTWLADAPPGGRQLRRSRTPPHRALQGVARHQARAAHRQAVEPDQHQEPTHQPALLLRPDHRLGLPEPAATAARVRRRPAHRRQAAAAVSRRRRGHQAPAGRRGPIPTRSPG